MDAIEEALMKLEALDGEVTSEIIKDLISDHRGTRQKMQDNYERYKATQEGVPIYDREHTDKNKINRKLANDFFSEIVDTKVGYMVGNPISYSVEIESSDEEEGRDVEQEQKDMGIRLQSKLREFTNRNNIDDLDAETVKIMAICGLSARLLYVNADGKQKAMHVDPWECIFVTDRSIAEPQFALRYYPILHKQQDNTFARRTRVEWYDPEEIRFYVEDDEGNFVWDETEPRNPLPHKFGGVPLIGYENNSEHLGDADRVLSLIDAYDRSLSDVNSELEQFRLAYMAFYGVDIDEETIERAKRTGAFGGLQAGDEVGFITKQLDDQVVEHHLDRLETNIMRFAKSVNFTDVAFAGQQSGISIRYKMLPLESKTITAERKFTAANRRMWEMVCNIWETKDGTPYDYTGIEHQFTRNIPINLEEEAETTQALKGMVSEETRLSLLTFVADAAAEKEKLEEDQAMGPLDLDAMVDDEDEQIGG